MIIEIDYNGKTYFGYQKTTDEEYDEFVKEFYDNFATYNTFSIPLEVGDHGTLIMSREAIQRAVFRFYKK